MATAKKDAANFPDIAVAFSEDQQAALRFRFMESMSPTTQKLDRVRFRDLLLDNFAIGEQLIMDRIFRVFDVDLDGWLSWEEFARGVAVFANSGDHIKFCFRVYDLNGDANISKSSMMLLLRSSMSSERAAAIERNNAGQTTDDDENVKELVDLVHKRLDSDHDQKVNLADFTAAVTKEPLLLQCLGICLPTGKEMRTFLQVPEGVKLPDRTRRRSNVAAQ